MSDVAEKILDKCTPVTETGCWLWDEYCTPTEYGVVRVGNKRLRAHRVAYTTFIGEIPEGMLVCHKCDVPSCVNPAHLFLGTHQDNMDDKVRKGRHDGNYKYSVFDVAFAMLCAEYMTEAEVAEHTGMSRSTIQRYKKKWGIKRVALESGRTQDSEHS